MFLSSYESVVDTKKRVSVPASFRKALGGEDSVFIWPSIGKPCLEGGGQRLVRNIRRSIARLNPFDEVAEAFETLILGRGRFCRLDDGGRIVLDADFMAHAKLSERVCFVGRGGRFEIWSPETQTARTEEMVRVATANRHMLAPFDDLDDDAPSARDPWEPA